MARTLRRRMRQKLTYWATPIKPWLRHNLCVFHSARVGSTVLGAQLNEHPRVVWKGEVYWEDQQRRLETPPDEPFETEKSPDRTMWQAMKQGGMKNFGAEVQFAHLRMYGLTVASFLPWLTRHHFTHFLVQNRRNVLKQIVSSSVLYKRKQWRQVTGETTRLTHVTLDLDAMPYHGELWNLMDLIEWIKTQHDLAIDSLRGKRLLTLTYEDDIEQDPRVAYRKVCAFLGIEPVDVPVRDTKMNPFTLSEMIENYDEVAECLRGTPHAWMLESDGDQTAAANSGTT